MAETSSSPEKVQREMPTKPLDQIREEKIYGTELCNKLADYLKLPVSGEDLYDAMEEIFSSIGPKSSEIKSSLTAPEGSSTKIGVDEGLDQLTNISQKRTVWQELLHDYSFNPDMTMEDRDILLKAEDLSLHKVIMEIIWYGIQKENALQKIDKLGDYHLPKNAALMSVIASEVSQEYAEEFFEKGRWEFIKKTFALPEKVTDIMKAKAGELVEKAKPALKGYLGDMPTDKQQKMFGRMVKFLSEDQIGQRLVTMAEGLPGAAVAEGIGTSMKSTLSGVKEGLFSPLCACMMSVMLDGAENKEKALIQYVTFLVAGQLVQEGGKLPFKLISHFAELAPKNAQVRKLHDFLLKAEKAGGRFSQHLILTASVALVIAAFQWEPGVKFVSEVANSIDESWDHSASREIIIGGLSTASYLMQFTSKRFIPLALAIEGGKMALDGVNPFADQDEFLFKFITGDGDNLIQTVEQIGRRNPIDAWNARVEHEKKDNNPVQKALIEYTKLADARDWALRTIVPFHQELSEFQFEEEQIRTSLRELSNSPQGNQEIPKLQDMDKLRYLDYALAGEDVWNQRDDMRAEVLLSGRNDKALTWLDDVEGSVEDKLDEFFEHECDALIAREKNKCHDDPDALKKLEPWVEQMENLRSHWTTMRSLADSLARRVVIARGLGIYDKKTWNAPHEGNPFIEPKESENPTMAFTGMMAEIRRRSDILDVTTPVSAKNANDILDAAGASLRMYGDDIVDSQWRQKDEAEYIKWAERNGFNIDDRHVHFDRVKQLIREAYKAGLAPEYIEQILKPVSDIARNQSEGKYVTPDIVSGIEEKIGKHLLDRALYNTIKEGNFVVGKPSTLHYVCAGYELTRTFTARPPEGTVRDSQVVIEDRMKTTSKRGRIDGEPSQSMISEKSIGIEKISFPRFVRRIQTLQNKSLLEKQTSEKEAQILQVQTREKALLREQKEIHRSESEEAFCDYYDHPELSLASWKKISEKGSIPVIYARSESGDSMNSVREKGWSWGTSRNLNPIVATVYFGPGNIGEAKLSHISELRDLDKNMQDAFRHILVSGKIENPIKTIINMVDRSVLTDVVGFRREKFIGSITYDVSELGTKRDYGDDLAVQLTPYYEKTSDKQKFLSRTLDAVIKHPGISGETLDTIITEITQ